MSTPLASLMLAPPFWQFQTMALLDQDPPVTGTWYTVLDTVYNAYIAKTAVRQINDETDAKNIVVRITIDGVTLQENGGSGWTAANNTWYSMFLNRDVNEIDATGSDVLLALWGKSIKIEVKTGTAVGTNQKLDGRVVYFKML